ncbi:MAG TPA: ATP-binding protein [Arenimonas sp.]|uniref:ATP-binding protein n=1 Tax=Arenimonas sp. TaxID=1872635 RepID=UPI002D7E81F8|nr:ATP-binding protein [Arenimonas sp.]HEU0152093.1 ATP-binding protein [Arenimonas sp.]
MGPKPNVAQGEAGRGQPCGVVRCVRALAGASMLAAAMALATEVPPSVMPDASLPRAPGVAPALSAAREPAALAVVALERLVDGKVHALPVDARLLRLAPDDDALRVRVRLVPSSSPTSPRIRFWLEGHDPGWIEPEPLGERLFQRLAPGSYRLRIAWAGRDGTWRERPGLAVWVEPPWWQGQYALALFGLLALVLAALASRELRARHRRREAWRLTRARQQLAEQHSEAKSRFLATLGHEIRTPMTGVLGMAELLQGGALDPRQRGQVAAIQRAGQHLLRLVNDALDLARIEAGRLELALAPFTLRPLLDEVADLLRPLAEAKGLRFELACAPGLPVALLGDATRLRQILFNLGHNAIKFCDVGGVRLRVEPRQPEGLVLSVHDDGPGLGPEEQARLFRRFEQGGAGSGSGGTGLGLAICRELAVAMGGGISVHSAPGQGAHFQVSLPLPAVAAPATGCALPPAAGPPRRLLLVEDDAVVAEVVAALLQQQGHRVRHVPHALGALAELATDHYDVAVLDLDLPGLDGLQLARLLRTRGETLPLLALTARADPQAEPEARAAGMHGFLRKPVTGELLALAIAGLGPARPPELRPGG